jgi:hypothetical protein
MTRIQTQSPVPYVSTNDVRLHNPPLATTANQDFPSLLPARPEPSLSSGDPENTQQQPKPAAPMPHPPDAEATLDHLLACRTMSSNAAGRSGRSMGSSTTALPHVDCSVDDTVDHTGTAGLACAAERGVILRAEYIRGLLARRAGSCRNGPDDELPVECAPKDPAMAEEQLASIVIWIPVEYLRTPLQSTRPRKRRRNPPSTDGHLRDEPGGDVDGTE